MEKSNNGKTEKIEKYIKTLAGFKEDEAVNIPKYLYNFLHKKVEKELKKRGKEFSDSNLEEMDEIWNEVKKSSI